MKVLLTSDWYPTAINGVVTSVMNLKRELELRGHEVKLLTLNTENKSDQISEDIYALGSVSVNKIYPDARATARIFSHLVAELIEWHPDIVHSNCEFTTFPLAKRIAHACNAPLLNTYHTVYEDYTHYFCPSKTVGHALVKEFTKAVASQIDGMIAPTAKVDELLRGYGVGCPIYTIPTGINLEKFENAPSAEWIAEQKNKYGIAADKKVILFLGRLAKEKNIEELLECATHMPDSYMLLIVGGGPDYDRLLEIKEKLGLGDDKVVFTGMVSPDDVHMYYRLGDIFCSASTSETQGLTYIEALSCGLPLICRYDTCLDGVIYNGENGWTFREISELMEHLRDLNESDCDKRLQEMGQRSLEIAEDFSTKVFGDRVEAAYLEMLKIGAKPKTTIKVRNELYEFVGKLGSFVLKDRE